MSEEQSGEVSGEVLESSESQVASPVAKSFWIIGALALVWNLIGVVAYIMQMTMTDEALLALPEAERTLYQHVPAWATAAFALAVNGGALGCLLLLMRRAWAFAVLVVSLVAILVQMYHSLFMVKSIEVYGPGGVIMPVMVIGVGVFLVWYANKARDRGWIR